MATFNVASASELNSAISNAQGGDTILLAAGNYGQLDLDGVNFSSDVTIKSANINNQATFGQTMIDDSSNIKFENLDFNFGTNSVGQSTFLFLTENVDGITVNNSTFTGAQDAGGFGYGNGVGIGGGSKNVTFSGNELSSFYYGMVSGGSEDVIIRNNEISNFSADSMQLLSVTDMLIEGNYLHDARKPATSGVHQDFIQMFSRPGVDPTSGLTIRNNILDIGEGMVPQGIFLGNEMISDHGGGIESYYRDIVVEGNVLYGARYNGILVAETIGVTVRNNTILQAESPMAPGFVGGSFAPAISVIATSQNVTVTDNVAAATVGDIGVNWNVSGNVDVRLADYANYFTSQSLANGAPNNWVVIEGSIIDGVGADSLDTGTDTGNPDPDPDPTPVPINYVDLLGDLFGSAGSQSIQSLDTLPTATDINFPIEQFIFEEEGTVSNDTVVTLRESGSDQVNQTPVVTLDFDLDQINISFEAGEDTYYMCEAFIAQKTGAGDGGVSDVAIEPLQVALDFEVQTDDFLNLLF